MGAEQAYVTVARVVKPQGRHGEIAAEILTDFPEKFSPEERKQLSALLPAGSRRECRLERAWFHKGRVVLKFAGVDSISQAEELVGAELQIPLAQRAKLEEGAYFIGELVGCRVTESSSGEAKTLGEITEVRFGAGEAPLLVISAAGGKEYLVPFAQAYTRRVDVEAKNIELQLPQGMLDLDVPMTAEEKERQRR